MKIEVTLEDRTTMICEVQFYVDAFLSLKKCQHKTYEVSRADPKNYTSLLMPLFNKNPHASVDMSKSHAIEEATEYFTTMRNKEKASSRREAMRLDTSVEIELATL